MNNEQRQRYDRHIRLSSVGEQGQENLLNSRVLIMGMGGLGSPVALYLAAAGVGHIVLSDYDVVESSNLQRQVIHTQESIGELKVDSAKSQLLRMNPDIQITTIPYELDKTELHKQCELADVVVDCIDNFPGRFLINTACLETKTPLISGAAIKEEGQIISFDARSENSPCYQCLYKDIGVEGASCQREGVVSPVVGIVGTMQAQETINMLLGRSALTGILMILDAQTLNWQRITLPKDPFCLSCSVTNNVE